MRDSVLAPIAFDATTFDPSIFTDQSAHALQLSLVSGDLDTRQFSVLRRDCRNFSFGAGLIVGVEALIIGASHAIGYRCGDWRGWETFACTGVEGAPVTFCEGVSKLQTRREWDLDGHRFEFEAQLCSWDEGCARAKELELAARHPVADQIRLCATFPRGECAQTPQTSIHVAAHDGAVSVETAHSYPNEAQIVFTQSRFWPGR